jgi:23S rRNA pseudouridine2605 synthase
MKQSDLIDQNPKAEASDTKPVAPTGEVGASLDEHDTKLPIRAKRAPRVKKEPSIQTDEVKAIENLEATPVVKAVRKPRVRATKAAESAPELAPLASVPLIGQVAVAEVTASEVIAPPSERPPRGPRRARSPRQEAGQGPDPIREPFAPVDGDVVQPHNLVADPATGDVAPQVLENQGQTLRPQRQRRERGGRDGSRLDTGEHPAGEQQTRGNEVGAGERGPRRPGARPERGPRPGARGPRPDGPRDRSMDFPVSAEDAAEPIPALQLVAPLGLSIDPARRRDRNEPSEFDEKLHKVLADAGVGSRREMEELIHAGRISVNGRPAHTGQRVGPADQIRVNGRTLRRAIAPMPTQVLLYHKPSGEICTRDDPQHRSTVYERLPRLKGARWVAVGRLDFNTEGLLVFTTSGDLANKLMHPRYGWEREYAVRVLGRVNEDAQKRLLEGIQLEDGIAKVNSISEIGGEAANAWYRVCISEGRNREVRRLMEAVGVIVSRLVRVRFGPIALPPGLSRTRWVELTPNDVFELEALVKKQVLTSEGRDPAEIEALLSAAAGARRRLAELDQDDEYDAHGRPDSDDESAQVFYDDEPIPAYVDAGVVDDTVPELTGEQAEDDWQPRSANAHLEGISKVVRKGDKSKGAKGARPPRGRGFGAGQGAGPGRGGPAMPTFGARAGAGASQGKNRSFKDRGRAPAPAGVWDPAAATGPWTGGPMGPALGAQDRSQGGRPGRGPRPNGQGVGPGGRRPGGPGPQGAGRGKPGQGGQGGQGQGGQGRHGQGGRGAQGGRGGQGNRQDRGAFPAEGQGVAQNFDNYPNTDGNVANGPGNVPGRAPGDGRGQPGQGGNGNGASFGQNQGRGKPRRPKRSGPRRLPDGQGGEPSGGTGGTPVPESGE